MRRSMFAIAALVALVGLTACDGDSTGMEDPGPYTLTFEGDASFQGAHGGQTLRAALVSGGTVEATAETTVSASADPAFSLTFEDAVAADQSYEIHYWIDSNFGGGAEAVCDGPDTDHQWSLDVPSATEDLTVTDTHRPTETMDVCATFAADLTFQGDASFQGPHGGQAIQVGVVRSSDGTLVVSSSGTVSASADPSFSFDFPGALLKGVGYEVHYWIDSNFGDGTAGTCDEVDDDHQWAVDLGSTMESTVTHTESHDAGAQSAVCSTFN
ncbi:MAG: hypothetical protein R3314_01700 [Longimicrobiales bacterium]|nr:hypothetical protein [Longimicrobiales bacterium]